MSSIASIITSMTRPDALAPIIGLEATVTGGRTIQAHKRGGKDEARERLIEETTGALVWLFGVEVLNSFGDKILEKILKTKNVNFDVGTDKILRTPFDNFMKGAAPKGISGRTVALLKGLKVVTSIIIANLFIGFVVPRINHAITNKLHSHDKKLSPTVTELPQNESENKDNINDAQNPAFKGAINAINIFTNAIENTNTGKLLSTDVGIAGGRMFSARNKEERREIGIRDIGSIYFYMWAQGHIRGLLNLIETGKFNRLDPSASNLLTEHINKILEKYGTKGEMTVEEFKKVMLGEGKKDSSLLDSIKFEQNELSKFQKILNKFRSTPKEPLQVVKVSELEKLVSDASLMQRIREMSKLQPLRRGEAVVTKQQIIDAMNVCEMNNPEFLDKAFDSLTSGASKNEYKYVSNSKLYNHKKVMEEYIERLCKNAKNGKINTDFVKRFTNRNILFSGINFVAGFTIAAIFLSTLIPKFQYWVTKKTTGLNEFPGMYDEKTRLSIEG